MEIRRFWLMLVEQLAYRRGERGEHGEHARSIHKVLKELRVRERALLDERDAATDDDHRESLSGKLDVLRAQRAKGMRVLRELREQRLSPWRRRAARQKPAEVQNTSADAGTPEHNSRG